MIQRYTHIIWDWNGTLFDDAWLCTSVMNGLLTRRNLPTLTTERYQAIFTFPVRDYYQTLGFDFGQDSFEQLSVEFMAAYEARRNECGLHPQARHVLAAIQRAGIPQSILSAYPYLDLIKVVRHFELEHFFIQLIGLGDIYAASKIELGRNWMQELGQRPSSVLLIGDTLHDYEVATAIGANCLLVAGGHNSKERLCQCPVPVIDSLQEIIAPVGHTKF
jgi:phosphoglycolate phosphatase